MINPEEKIGGNNTLWKHKHNDHIYKIISYRFCRIEATNEPAVVYTRADGKEKTRWIRPLSEFLDGRFQRVLNEKKERKED